MEISARSPSNESTTKGIERLPSLKQTVADLNGKIGDFIISAEMHLRLLT